MQRIIPFAFGLGVLLPALSAAQAPTTVGPGDTVRFRTERNAPWQVGAVRSLGAGELVVDAASGAMAVPVSDLQRLEVRRPRRFDGPQAAIGAGIGFGLGAVGVIYEDGAPWWGVAASGGWFALCGAALGGGGNRAARGLLIGSAAGAVPGAILGSASGEPCPPDAWLCFGSDFYALVGAAGGAAVGGLIGAWIGALTGHVWQPVAPAYLILEPGARGRLGVSLAVRR